MNTRELELYREVASMTGEVMYTYDILTDTMTMYKGDSAQKGLSTTINNYVGMLRNQIFSDEYKNNMQGYISALSTGEPSFFNYDIKTKMDGYQENHYNAVGKTIYDDNNTPVAVIGKFFPVEGVDSELVTGKVDRNTGVFKAQEFRKQLADKYAEMEGKAGGFMLLSFAEVHKTTDENFEASLDKLYVNLAQCLARLFSYNTLIGRVKKDEFGVVYFGRDVSGEFLAKVEELKDELDELVGRELMEAGVHVCGGVSCEPFVNDGRYTALNNAGKAMGFAKYTEANAIWMYSEDLGEAYNVYHSEDKRLKTAQMKLEHKLIQSSIKILADTQDVKATIMKMFDIVGKAFNLDRISIYEYSHNNGPDVTVQSWEKGDQCQCFGNRTMSINKELIKLFNSQVKLAVVNDASKITPEDPLFGALTDKIKSFVLTGYKVGTVSGCISFESHENKHKWTSEELNIFELVKRIISTCLITVRLYYELINAKKEGIKYDSITGLYKYNVFLEAANEYIASHPEEKLAVVTLKLDGFVRVNQFYGYDAGDEILKDYANVLKKDAQRFIMGSRVNGGALVGLLKLFDSRGSMISEATAGVMYAEFLRNYKSKYPAAELGVQAGMCRVDNNGRGISEFIESAEQIMKRG